MEILIIWGEWEEEMKMIEEIEEEMKEEGVII